MAYWILLLLAGLTLTSGGEKMWRHNTNFTNPDNWSLKRAPCSLDRVTFPRSFKRLSVLLPEGTTELREMVLPSDGELILPRSGQIILNERPAKSADCDKGGENTFLRTGLKDWLDPVNWIPKAFDPSEATPHLERIPCQHDVVTFPEDASIGVRLPEFPVRIFGIKLGLGNVDTLTLDEWWDILRSIGGWRFFSGPETIREETVQMNYRRCTDPAGCVCVPHNYILQELVCRYGKRECESKGHPPCSSPIIPHGHCCAICGSFLEVHFQPSVFTQKALSAQVTELLKTEAAEGQVLFHISRLEGPKVQIVLVDNGTYSEKSVEFAQKLYSALKNNLELGVRSVYLQASGAVLEPDAVSRQIALVFGTLMATLLVLGGIFMVFVVCRHRLPMSLVDGQAFVFARFENLDTDAEAVEVVARPAAPRFQQKEDEASFSKSFDNPMYGKGKTEVQELPASSQVTHENPVYAELKKRDEEPKDIVEVTEMKEMKREEQEEEDDGDDEELVEIDIEERTKPKDL